MIHLQPKLMAALREPGVPPVLAALRDALRLEFATIPPYLCRRKIEMSPCAQSRDDTPWVTGRRRVTWTGSLQ